MRSTMRPPKPHKQPVDKSIFRSGLKSLGPATSGGYAFLQLDLKNRNLYSVIGIQNYQHLQHIDLSQNQLISLSSLSKIKHILSLNASSNKLKKLFDFTPPSNLIYANFSQNQISSMTEASKCKYLQLLKLDDNSLSEISGIQHLPNLQFLSLSGNNIQGLAGFPTSLQSLSMARNGIIRIGNGLMPLQLLRSLDLSYNKISSLKGLESLQSLMSLKLKGNLIRKVLTLDPLSDISLISDLELNENEVQEQMHYRLRVVFKLPQLRSLDGVDIQAEEKIKAQNLFGLDLEDRKALHNEIFPGQPFVDRRLVTSDMLDYESESDREDINFFDANPPRTGSQASRQMSKRSSRASGSMDGDVLAFTKRYVGELIEKVESEEQSDGYLVQKRINLREF